MGSSAGFPVEARHLEPFTERAGQLLASVRWTPAKPVGGAGARVSPRRWRESTIESGGEQEISLVGAARRVSRDQVLLAEEANHVLCEVRQGLRLAMHVSREYTKASGLEALIAQNARGALTDAQKTEFRAKYHSASAITVFTLAYYVVWTLADYKSEDVDTLSLTLSGPPETELSNPVRALECALWYYGATLEQSGLAGTPLEMVKLTSLFFRALIDEVKLREESLRHVEPFTENVYLLAGTEFALHGFRVELGDGRTSIEFNRVALGDIVGNREAKHKARRLAERLLCYDPTTQRNPIHDLGGLPTLRMGFGIPGTGKSMQIAATATLLHDHCRELGIPFLFWPLPDNVISTFQGGSGERMLAWMRPLRETSRIVYGPIDDAENVLEDRTRQGVSAGVREVVAVFLRNTEGAYAVHHGNAAIEIFTNLPDQIDPAVLSRIMDRFTIGGAQTDADFLDQDYLWWRRYREVDPDFVTADAPAGHEFLAAQALSERFGEIVAAEEISPPVRLAEVLARVGERHQRAEHAYFAALYEGVKAVFPGFSSRDVRNIQRAVDERILDFDLPDAWLEDPAVFFRQDYDTKHAMLVELMRGNLRDLAFHDLRYEEAVRYLESYVAIAEGGRARRIDSLAEEMALQREARARLDADRAR